MKTPNVVSAVLLAVAILAAFSLVPSELSAKGPRFGTVLSAQKISATEGEFLGDLAKMDRFGVSIGVVGDLDGDGRSEICVGAIGDDAGGEDAGAVWILFLDAGGTVRRQQEISATRGGFGGELDAEDLFGAAADGPGDIDGDGVCDLVVGVYSDDDGGDERGAVWVLFLKADGTVKAEQKISATQGGFAGTLDDGDSFGFSVAGLGDFDGDGVPDVVVGARGDDDGGKTRDAYLARGALWILLLNRDGTVKDHRKISATEGGFTGKLDVGDMFGAVDSLGDLDGDGVVDLVVGAGGDDDGAKKGSLRDLTDSSEYGAVWILFLSPDGSVKRHQKISRTKGGFKGKLKIENRFGTSVATLSDLNGDGTDDLAVGALTDHDGGFKQGAVWILFLSPDGTVKGQQKISEKAGSFPGKLKAGDHFGRDLASPGDLDGDGVADLFVGAFLDDDGAKDAGAVWTIFLDGFSGVDAHDGPLVPGDRVTGAMTGEATHTFRFDAVADTQLSLKCSRTFGDMEPAIRVIDPIGTEVMGVSQSVVSTKTARVRKLTLARTGSYRLEIVNLTRAGGIYSLTTKAKVPKKVKTVVAVGTAGGAATLDAVAGSTVKKLVVKSLKPKGEYAEIDGVPANLVPRIMSLVGPDGKEVDIAPFLRTKGSSVTLLDLPLASPGVYTLNVGGVDSTVGYAHVAATVVAPKGREARRIP